MTGHRYAILGQPVPVKRELDNSRGEWKQRKRGRRGAGLEGGRGVGPEAKEMKDVEFEPNATNSNVRQLLVRIAQVAKYQVVEQVMLTPEFLLAVATTLSSENIACFCMAPEANNYETNRKTRSTRTQLHGPACTSFSWVS